MIRLLRALLTLSGLAPLVWAQNPPVFVSPPGDLTVSDGGGLTLNVVVDTSFTIEQRNLGFGFVIDVQVPAPVSWRLLLAGRTLTPTAVASSQNNLRISASLSFGPVGLADAGSFQLEASNVFGATPSVSRALAVAAVPPNLTVQPESRSVTVGTAVVLGVGVANSPPLTYQWRRNGTEIPGATGSSLSFTTVTLADAGTYDVVVGNTAGTVTSNPAVLTVTLQPQTITFLPPTEKTFGDGPFPLSATASSGLPVTVAVVSGPATLSGSTLTLSGAGTVILRATQPGDATYAAAEAVERTLTVAKITPVLTWPAPAAILAGTALGATQLNATASVPGTFAYTPAAGAVLAAGTQSLSVTFTPTDAANYTSATGTVSLTVNLQSQAITFPALGDRTFGDAPLAVGATASSGLPVTLAVASGPATLSGGTLTLTGAGTVTLRATQTGNATYAAATPVERTFTVAQATPVVTWATPAALGQGTALGAAQLNATASVAGTFAYSPAAGTVLPAGAQTLNVTFTPTDSTNYSSVSRSVSLTVHPPPPAITSPATASAVVGAAFSYQIAGSNTPTAFTASGLPAGLSLNPATGLISGTPTTAGTATVGLTASNAGGSSAPFNLTLTVIAVPVITTPPAGAIVRTGGDLTLTVVASSVVTPTYQWRKDGTPLSGATGASLSLTGITLGQAGAYSVAVTNPAGEAVSAAALVVVLDVQAAHALNEAGYLAGGTVTVTNTLTFSPGLTSLSWEVLLPAGWTYASGAGAEGGTKPTVGTADLLTWNWSPVPASPVVFSYTLNVPAGTTGEKTLSALVRPGVAAGALQLLAQPDPLRLPPVSHHSADSNRDYQIGLLELTRMVELYNVRNAGSRTGCYRVEAGTEDGFAPEPARTAAAVAVLARYHSADTNRDGKIGLLELTRVIELYNFREGGKRTGRYQVQAGTEDGFAPGG